MKSKQLISNRLLCLLCDDLIESRYRHDYVSCRCGSCATDGGTFYIKHTGDSINYLDLSIYSNKHSDHRKYLKWGNIYDKNMNKLPEVRLIAIKDMDTAHIKAVLDPRWRIDPFYAKVFRKELKFRNK